MVRQAHHERVECTTDELNLTTNGQDLPWRSGIRSPHQEHGGMSEESLDSWRFWGSWVYPP
jgi:hypothetical protein